MDQLPHIKSALAVGGIGVWLWSAQTQQLQADSLTLGCFGFEPVDYVGPADQFLLRIFPEDKIRFEAQAANSLRARIPFTAEFRVLWPDESVHLLGVKGQAEVDPTGAAQSFTGICQEIGHQRLQYEVEKKLAIFEERDEFIAALAHDLRVPLVGSERILSMLISGQLGQMQASHVDLLEKIRNSEQALLLMINNLLDVYRLEANAEAFAFGPVNLGSLVNRCCDDLSALIESKFIKVEKNIEEHQPMVQADAMAMQRVVYNLMSNAIKFSPPSTTIRVDVTHTKDRVRLTIQDNGPGITSSDLEKLFERFWQSNKVNRAIGTGLGLYLCRKIIEAHHGEIHCDSKLGTGSNFVVELPLASQKKSRILIADDNPDMRVLLARYLQSFDVDIDVAAGGYEAVQASYGVSYDAIFLDLQMPDLDGYSAARAIRKNGSRVPIFAFTAYADSRAQMSEAGMTDMLEKPIDRNTLTRLLDHYVFSKAADGDGDHN